LSFRGDSPDELQAWLRQLLLHNLGNFARRYRETAKREVGREVQMEQETPSGGMGAAVPADTPSPSGHAVAREQADAIEQAVARLPDDHREVVRLRYLERRSFHEVAQLLGRSENAVRKLWLRAIERLQHEMEHPP